MREKGKTNSITDIEGIKVGNYTDKEALTGVTVILPSSRLTAGVDVRGAAPGTREIALLNPVNLIQKIDAVTLSGGSAYGLVSASGVMRYLEENNQGYKTKDDQIVPIVPAAIIYDLNRGKITRRPSPEHGYLASKNATNKPVEQGNVGAGTGAKSGTLKGGLGTASEKVSEFTVGALVIVNSVGSIVDFETGIPYARYLEISDEFRELRNDIVPKYGFPNINEKVSRNTIIAVIATDLDITKTEATRVSQMAHDGVARAVYPSHTMYDGDTVFTLATAEKPVQEEDRVKLINKLGCISADTISRAIIHAVLNAETVFNIKNIKEAYPQAFRKVM
jgi:L-aminopeptidase/D-esterase-like protein